MADDIPFFRKGLCNDKRHRGNRREQGFLFSQLGNIKASTRSLYESSWRSHRAKDKTWGECGEYGRAGRFGQKSGQQVTSAFAASTHNERIKAVYGNYCFWSWLRYWHIDTPEFITLTLIDKGYYDYDYEAVKKPVYAKHDQSEERIQNMMNRFGFGKVKKFDNPSPEELQAEVWKEEQKKHVKNN